MSGKDRSLAQLRKLPMSQLTDEERLLVYGEGNPNRMLYRLVQREDGSQAIVHRQFEPGEKVPDGWKESPADFGVETHPQNRVTKDEDFEGVVATLPPKAAKPTK